MISRHEEVQTGATALRGWRMYGVGILNLFHGRHLTAFLIPLTIKNNANSAPPQRYNHFLIRASFAPSPTAPPIWSQSPRVDSSSLLTVYIRILFGSILKVFELRNLQIKFINFEFWFDWTIADFSENMLKVKTIQIILSYSLQVVLMFYEFLYSVDKLSMTKLIGWPASMVKGSLPAFYGLETQFDLI